MAEVQYWRPRPKFLKNGDLEDGFSVHSPRMMYNNQFPEVYNDMTISKRKLL